MLFTGNIRSMISLMEVGRNGEKKKGEVLG